MRQTFWGQLFLVDEPPTIWKGPNNIIAKPNDVVNRVQVLSSESLDWSEGHPRIKKFAFPAYLPTILFEHKKEDSIVEFNVFEYYFKLHLKQRFYKYKYLGIFQEALATINNYE